MKTKAEQAATIIEKMIVDAERLKVELKATSDYIRETGDAIHATSVYAEIIDFAQGCRVGSLMALLAKEEK